MGASSSSASALAAQAAAAQAAAERAEVAAGLAEEHASTARMAARDAAIAKDEVLAMPVPDSTLQAQVQEPEAASHSRRSWFPRGWGSNTQGDSARQWYESRLQKQMHAVSKAAEAQAAKSRAETSRLESELAAVQTARAAAQARAEESYASVKPLRDRANAAERRVQEQNYIWVGTFVIGLALGVVIGVLFGAAAAASSSVDEKVGAAGSEPLDTRAGIVGAIAGLTFQMLCLSNVLHAVGGVALTGVFVYFLFLFWIGLIAKPSETDVKWAARITLFMSIGYVGILIMVGDRIWDRGDDGSRILGGIFYCGVALAVPGMVCCALCELGWRVFLGMHSLGSATRLSLADFNLLGPALALVIVAAVSLGATALLYSRSGFPLLMIPASFYAYVAIVACIATAWRCLSLPRLNTAFLQPEVIATLLFGVFALVLARFTMNHDNRPSSVCLALLVSGMSAVLVALPAVLLGCLDVTLPSARRPNMAGVSLYQPLTLLSRCAELIGAVQDTLAYGLVSAVYMSVWTIIMTHALRLHLWTCRPFALISINTLCVASPNRSIPWALIFRVPIGLWLLAVTAFIETAGKTTMDPVLQDVLQWLGPQPAPFLHLFNGALQVCAASTSMTCLAFGIFCARQQLGQRSWMVTALCWLVSMLALAVRMESSSMMLSLCLAGWAAAFFATGVRHTPSWGGTFTRLVILVAASRLCCIADNSALMVLFCSSMICLVSVSAAFGESDAIGKVRRSLVHSDAAAAHEEAFVVRLVLGGVLFLHGVAADEALLVMLGCFSVYISMASTVASRDSVSWAIVVAACGLATMFLGELVQMYTIPMHNALMALLNSTPLGHVSALVTNQDLPLDLWAMRELLHDFMSLVTGVLRE